MSPKVTEDYKEKRRLEILEVAKKVFIKKGYEATTMKDIVDESGLSRGGVYQYFSSTEEMFQAIVVQGDIESTNFINLIIQDQTPIWESMKKLVNDYRTISNDTFATVQFEYSVTGWREDDRLQYIRNRGNHFRQLFVSVLEEGIRRGEFQPIQPLQAIVDFMLNVQDGFLLWSKIMNPSEKESLNGQIDALLFYLSKVLKVKE